MPRTITRTINGVRAMGKAKLEKFSSVDAAVAGDRRKTVKRYRVNRKAAEQVQFWINRGGKLPISAMREAIGTGAWDSLMLDRMHKRLTRGWSSVAEKYHWSKIVSLIKPVSDFRTQYALQFGEFTTAEKVPEKGNYHEVELTDDQASYAVYKYGQLFGLSYETMTNDDLGAFSTILQKLGAMMQRTVEKFVFTTMLNANPTIYDGVALFHSGSHGNDLGATKPLNHDNFEAASELLMAQTDIDGNPLDVEPKYIIVNPAQKYDAQRLLRSHGRTGTGNNDINVHEGEVEIISTSRVTSGSWFLLADPAMVETFEIGFLGGRQAPEIFEENPLSGHAFENDERRWKVREVFGGAWVDYRGVVRANV